MPAETETSADSRARADRHQFRYYDLLVHAFVVVLLVSNLVAQKICAIGPFEIGGVTLGPFYVSAAQARISAMVE